MSEYEEFTEAVASAVEAADREVRDRTEKYTWTSEEHQELKNEFISSYLTRWYEIRYGIATH